MYVGQRTLHSASSLDDYLPILPWIPDIIPGNILLSPYRPDPLRGSRREARPPSGGVQLRQLPGVQSDRHSKRGEMGPKEDVNLCSFGAIFLLLNHHHTPKV